MKVPFVKYHGTGNDFILIDNRTKKIKLTKKQISNFCHRRFGIGADGLMLLQSHSEFPFEMIYYNADGLKSSMCGNGGRCISAFAHSLGIFKEKVSFLAVGKIYHSYIIHQKGNNRKNISLRMNDVLKKNILHKKDFILNTGSPHYVKFVENIDLNNFVEEAKKIRYGKTWGEKGINVNFVSIEGKNKKSKSKISVRTYERGVEEETYSCGTGAVACALAMSLFQNSSTQKNTIQVQTKGGKLKVSFENCESSYIDIFLSGETTKVFCGEYSIPSA